MINKLFLLCILLLSFFFIASGSPTKLHKTQKGFPQHESYGFTIGPSIVTQEEMDTMVASFYRYWKKAYVKESNATANGYYIASGGGTGVTNGAVTVSEAQGFGMVITALMAGEGPLADSLGKKIFDGMFYFFKDHPGKNSPFLMSWEVLVDSLGHELPVKTTTATDGDLDIAYSLILAHYQWGSSGTINYLEEARSMISKGIYGKEIGATSKRLLLGDWDGETKYQTRPSDWMAGHLRCFANVTQNSYWTSAADTIYALANAFVTAYTCSTGLISDFVVGRIVKPAPENFLDEFKETDEYYNNACRVPMRIVADFAHYGTPQARTWLNTILGWLKKRTGNDPGNIVGGYFLSGGEIRQNKFPAFTAPFVAACIADSAHREYLDKGWRVMSVWRTNYYNDCINLLSMLLISGNWWRPGGAVAIVEKKPFPRVNQNLLKIRKINNSLLQCVFPFSVPAQSVVTIYALCGKKVFRKELESDAAQFYIDLSDARFTKNVYMYLVQLPQSSYRGRFTLVE
jgi:endo-1,4-beta-D-glucanase Y